MLRELWKREREAWRLLLRDVPAVTVAVFVLSVLAMNLLANKSIDLPVDWLALDCGILVSWAAFLTMDLVTRHFGPGAANRLSVLAVGLNLLCCAVFFLGSRLPGQWGEASLPGSEEVINTALNNTFGGVWYVLAGSTLAFLVSAAGNNFTNWGIGRLLGQRADGFGAYALRSWGSTAVGQLVDNLVFALTVSRVFFGWSLLQCFTCALTGMAAELLCQILFSPLGFRVSRRWSAAGIGEAYLRRGKEPM